MSATSGNMKRRAFLLGGLGCAVSTPLLASVRDKRFDAAAAVLAKATDSGQIHAASLFVRHQKTEFARAFGAARSADAIFLLASITKTMTAAAVMTLYDQGKFRLDDPIAKYIPEFSEGQRSLITLRHALTHVCGLPDQLPENQELRKRHAKLSDFVAGAVKTPLLFPPGSRYSYSSMGILLVSEVARRITGSDFLTFIDRAVFERLEMKRSALGLGRFKLDEVVKNQVGRAAPESGSGDPSAKNWDWNSLYWRRLGAPWGAAHGSALDVGRFLAEFLHPTGRLMKPETARLMIRNHNREGFRPRGLGFGVGKGAGSPGCSDRTFGHTGSTGTLAWADPATDTICVVLTTLPARAARPHPRNVAAERVAEAVS